MFLESSPKPIDSSLQTWVEKLEKTSPGLTVIAARQFRYSLIQTGIELKVTSPRKFNVLEEFILRASLENTPTPTEVELAQVLGLDPIFVRSTTANLQELNTLNVLPDGSLQLTPEGRTFYEKGSVPQPPERHLLYAIADPLLEVTAFESNPLRESVLNLPNLGDFLPLDSRIQPVDSLTLTEVQQLLTSQGLGFHSPESGKEVTAFQIAEPPETRWQAVALFAIFDTLNQRLTLQLRRGQQLLESATLWLEMLQSEGKVSLAELFEISSPPGEESFPRENPEVVARLEQVRQAAISGSAMLIPESQIQTQFLERLKTTTHQVLIYSPKLPEKEIDSCLLQGLETLMKRGVWILIGQGTVSEKSAETPAIFPEWLTKLAEIKTAEGLSAIQMVELGQSHAQEVVIDRQIYVCSAQNWVSCYSGFPPSLTLNPTDGGDSRIAPTDGDDRLPQGESCYQVTQPEIVSEAYNFLSTQFQQRAESLWQQTITTEDESLATLSLSIWGALGMAETSLQQIQEQGRDLLPIWLKIACQGLRSQQMSPDSPCFPLALSQLSELTPDSPQLDSLCEAWRQVMAVIADRDEAIALHLLSETVWQDFIRLGIASEAVESPDTFITTELPKHLPIPASGPPTPSKKPKPQKSR